ncbi:polysaccharide pyruvyl transferase family protein [Pannonibacter sp. I15F10I1]|uniref:polysaccharide pyruvyl transferase family protein n=1 Tax=Pannonibacter sp. I15F10I1 TaxID=2003580 RepID=UPI001647301C|nr:polysaccharide pyruvyl transferase family protein [Pannonibacter sp. I15F10I1]
MRVYFVGHTSFGNRGCEALIRSTVKIVRSRFPEAKFAVPSSNAKLDMRQWPNSKEFGVEFVGVEPHPERLKWWSRIHKRVYKGLYKFGRPTFTVSEATRREIEVSDAVIVSGGDVLSLDYELYSLYWHSGIIDAALALGKPVHVWAASIGPFNKVPEVEKQMVSLLKRVSSVSVRETATKAYLETLGIHVTQVGDPAFVLDPEPWSHPSLASPGTDGLLGFNVSPLVRRTVSGAAARDNFDNEIVNFLADVLNNSKLSIILVPHVGPLDGSPTNNSDSDYMKSLLQRVGVNDRIALIPDDRNAAQLKYAIGQCRYFIGARTHATIAAWSQGVPTCSIAYSVKARGLNKDIFDDDSVVLPTPEVSRKTLHAALDHLRRNEDRFVTLLRSSSDQLKANSYSALQLLSAGIE